MNKKMKLTKDQLSKLPYSVVVCVIFPFVSYRGEPIPPWPDGATLRPKYSYVNRLLFYGYFKRDIYRKVYFLWESVFLYLKIVPIELLNTLNKYASSLGLVHCELTDRKVEYSKIIFEKFKYLYVNIINWGWFDHLVDTEYHFKNITTLIIKESESYVRTVFDQIVILILDVSILHLPNPLPSGLKVLYIKNCAFYSVKNARDDILKLTQNVPTLFIENKGKLEYKRIDKNNSWVKRNIKDCSKKKCNNVVVLDEDVELDFEYCDWCKSYYCYECVREVMNACESCACNVCNDCFHMCNVCETTNPGEYQHCYDCVYPCKECNEDTCRIHSKYCSMCDKEDTESVICKLCRKKCQLCKKTRCKKHINDCCCL
jgi:hypothetical protein